MGGAAEVLSLINGAQQLNVYLAEGKAVATRASQEGGILMDPSIVARSESPSDAGLE